MFQKAAEEPRLATTRLGYAKRLRTLAGCVMPQRMDSLWRWVHPWRESIFFRWIVSGRRGVKVKRAAIALKTACR